MTTGRVRNATAVDRTDLNAGWEILAAAPGSLSGPDALPAAGWTSAAGASTVAGALRAAGAWSLDGPARRFDAEDWWWRTRFEVAARADDEEVALCFGGLATLADIWLDGVPLLSSRNMFVAHERRLEQGGRHDLVIRFRALDAELAARRPRPRWRAPMIEHQQLRWMRATLLGRTPGWSPPAAPVGPWRGVWIERRRGFVVDDVALSTRLDAGVGRLEIRCCLRVIAGAAPDRTDVVLARDGVEQRARLEDAARDGRLAAALAVTSPAEWRPHTHGAPDGYRARLEITRGASVDIVDLGMVGFRALTLDTAAGDFRFSIGGQPIFCRGACWTPLDPVTLSADRGALAVAIDQVVAAGMNMLRLSGTMVYETDDFYDLCDERGVLVWQDFMFANMDYPEDEAFVAGVRDEAAQLLARLQGRPSLALLCGSSEVEQQAAMWGAPRELWSPGLFHDVLPVLVRARCPDVPYWPSSAHGGAFPHQASSGSTSYYGVGAYLRPLDDARRAELRFASECLAFANVPAAAALPGGPGARVHHPGWKARTPRDLGAGWDFDDVRDHYLRVLFNVDPLELRSLESDRYLALSRVVTGEVMQAAFAEWRRARSTCRGALVWFLRDLWPGAGWGIIDATGAPKAAYHALRRALQPLSLSISDEGLNGIAVHVTNDRPLPLNADVELVLYRGGEALVGRARQPVAVAPHDARELQVGAWLEGFTDVAHAYRFGLPPCDVVVARLIAPAASAPLAEAFHFPAGLAFPRESDLGLEAEMTARPDGDADLVVRTRRFAQSVAIEVPGLAPDDDFFHIAPLGERRLRLRRAGADAARPGHVHAVNGARSIAIRMPA